VEGSFNSSAAKLRGVEHRESSAEEGSVVSHFGRSKRESNLWGVKGVKKEEGVEMREDGDAIGSGVRRRDIAQTGRPARAEKLLQVPLKGSGRVVEDS